MIEVGAFSQGLGSLALAVRQALDPPTIKLYHCVMDGLSQSDVTPEWGRYVHWCLKNGEWSEWFPKLEELKDSFMRWRRQAILALPPDSRTVEEKRTEFRDGFQSTFREALKAHGIDVDELVAGKDMPK